jgi:general stress protein CsbA
MTFLFYLLLITWVVPTLIMTIFCLKGCNWVLLSGHNLSKDDRKRFREQYDVITMNKYIGKMIFLPLALGGLISCVLLLISILASNDIAFFNSGWFATIIVFSALIFIALCFYAYVQVVGNRFKR